MARTPSGSGSSANIVWSVIHERPVQDWRFFCTVALACSEGGEIKNGNEEWDWDHAEE